MDIDCIQYTFMYTCTSKYLQAGVVIKVDGAILLKHLRKMLNYAIILDPSNFKTADHVYKEMTAFNTVRTKYLKN